MTDKEKEALLLLAGWHKLENCSWATEHSPNCWFKEDYNAADGKTPAHFLLDDAFERIANDNE